MPSERQAERALAAGAGELCFVLSVSEAHNASNVRRSRAQSVSEYRNIAAMMPAEMPIALAPDTFPQIQRWAFHAHDTYGLGAANVLAAYRAGVRVFDTSVAGLGGRPFAPGATGNVATEDLIWMFDGMAIETGIQLNRLLEVAREVAGLPGAQVGGRVRDALAATACN